MAADPPTHGTIRMDDDNETFITEQFINKNNKNHDNNSEPELLDPIETMESYPIEAKPTRTTFAETFSSGDDGDFVDDDNDNDNHYPHQDDQRHDDDEYVMGVNHTFSSEDAYPHGVPNLGASFINLAEEAAHGPSYSEDVDVDDDNDNNGRDDYLSNRLGTDSTYSSGEDFINLAQEAAAIPSRHFRTTTGMKEDEFESYAQMYGLEEEEEEEQVMEEEDGAVLQFVDSEDGQAFSFRTRTDHARLAATMTYENSSRHYRTMDIGLQQNVSLEATSMGYETCSKTLNTNLETLHTDLEGVNYIPTLNEHDVVHDSAYHHGQIELHGADGDVADGESYDDDDEQRIGGGGGGYGYDNTGGVGVPLVPSDSYTYEEDGFIRHPHHDPHGGLHKNNTFQETVTTFQDDTITEFTRDTKAAETHDGERTEVLSQLMDSYLSDHSSATSWDEGSYASGSRAVSRLDSFDGTDFTEDTGRGNGTLMDILKNFRDMNVRDRRDDISYSDDDEDGRSDIEEDGDGQRKRRSSRRRSRRRSSKRDLASVLGQIGAVGMDLLNETIEQTQQGSRSSSRRRRRRGDQAGKIIDSFRDIFSCGAPSGY